MSFLNEVDGLEIAEQHVMQLMGMEEDEAKKILAIYRKIRRELQTQLLIWSGPGLKERFTAQKVRGVLYQIDRALQAFGEDIGPAMARSGERASLLSLDQLESEITLFDDHFQGGISPINLDNMRFALNQNNFLIEQYQVSIDRWSGETRTKIGDRIRESIAREDTNHQVITDLLSGFEGLEWQLRRIIRTETHHIYNNSKLEGMGYVRSFEPTLMKTLYHPLDSRTADDSIFAMRLNLIVPIDEPFHYVWQPPNSKKRYERVFQAPPDRPNDRSILIPFSKKWRQE